MAYFDTPLANEAKNKSQPRIRNNFNVLKSFLSLNHQDPNLGTGKHTFVTLPIQAAPITAAGEAAIFTKTVNAHTEPYFVRDNLIADEIPLSTVFNHAMGTINYAVLPGGLKMRWGTSRTNATYPAGTPNYAGQTYRSLDINAGVPAEAQFTVAPTVIVSRQYDLANDTDAHSNRGFNVLSMTVVGAVATLVVVSFQTDHGNPAAAIDYTFNYIAIGI